MGKFSCRSSVHCSSFLLGYGQGCSPIKIEDEAALRFDSDMPDRMVQFVYFHKVLRCSDVIV